MTFETWTSLPHMFFDQAERLGDKPFLWAKNGDAWHPLSWREAAAKVEHLAKGLRALGITRGDRVVLVAENRPEWLIADVAIMTAGAVSVPAYTTNTEADHLHILINSGAKGAIVSTKALARRLLPAARQAPELEFVIGLDRLDADPGAQPRVLAWDDILIQGRDRPGNLADLLGGLRRDAVSCLIYTSGTGGVPKGVMLSHGAILCNCMGAFHVLEKLGLGDEVFLSFLPLSHSYEHTAGQFFPIAIGAQIYYAEGIDSLSANMLETHPTIMTAVPRLYQLMRGRILHGVKRKGGLTEKLFLRAVELGSLAYESPGRLGFVRRLENRLLDRLVRRKVAERFGGRLKAFVSGGAPLNYESGLFFVALGVTLLQGYGQTEAAPLVSCNQPANNKLHTVGPPVKDVEVRIAEDGEILVRGELVMKGYWGDAKATQDAIRDGWLHTGDIGCLDNDGNILITDRKKDIIVNSGGDNISPQRIEGFLALEPEIAQAMVYGDRRPHLVALVVPDPEFVARWAAERGEAADVVALSKSPDFHKVIGEAVARVNAKLSTIEKVRRFIILAEPFTVANEQLTPTMKIRRHILREAYGERLERLYHDGS